MLVVPVRSVTVPFALAQEVPITTWYSNELGEVPGFLGLVDGVDLEAWMWWSTLTGQMAEHYQESDDGFQVLVYHQLGKRKRLWHLKKANAVLRSAFMSSVAKNLLFNCS